jgi:5-methylcytosine-specific restriction endonuclease McrA
MNFWDYEFSANLISMISILFFSLAGIILLVTLRNYSKKPTLRRDDHRSEYLQTAVNKLRGKGKSHEHNGRWLFRTPYERRRDYYREEYLKSDAWSRKRYVVLRRDNWRCVYCGAPATQVHHKWYAKKNIGKEPIEWLVSICKPCHDSIHHK